jgi:hypothetical protein
MKVTVVGRDSESLVAVTVTVNVLATPLQERVEVPEVPRVIEAVESVQVNPDEGEVEFVSVTMPLKLFTAVTLMVELPVAPAKTVTLDGPAVIVKSWTVYEIMVECES